MSIKSKIQSLISAANNATGESDTTLTDAVQTLVDGYGQGGGGGSLPSVISKIDGGSFTLASDTAGDRQSVSHSLGVVPKGFVIWTEDELSGTVATRHIANCGATVINVTDRSSKHYACSGWVTILYNGAASIVNNALYTDAQISRIMDAQRIMWGNSLLFYKAGLTYKWLAWA